MTDTRKKFGDQAEQVAERYIRKLGYCILGRNVRFTSGEIDLIALHEEILVFCEVKARRGGQDLNPGESIHARKQLRLARLASEYLIKNPDHEDRYCRFDAILVRKTGPLWHVEVIADAFRPGW